MQPAVAKLLRFIENPVCQHYLELASNTYFEDFIESHDLEDLTDIHDILGDVAMQNILPCYLEFFFSNDYLEEDRPWNVIDLFLKKRSAMLNERDKGYLRSLRKSYMSLYEVLEVEMEKSILLRDLIGGGEPVRVFEKSMTRQLAVWDVIGVRLCSEAGRPVLAGGALMFDRDETTELVQDIKELHAAGMSFLRAANSNDSDMDGYSLEERERLMKVMWAVEIGNGYLESCFEKLNRKTIIQNSDGDPIQFHTVTFPLKTDWKNIATQLNSVPDYHQDDDSLTRKFWNWVQPVDKKKELAPSKDEDGAFVQMFETTLSCDDLDVTMRVLGTIELNKTKLIAQGNSEKRTKRLESRLISLLGENIGMASWKIEEAQSSKSKKETEKKSHKAKKTLQPDISPEEQTEFLHDMLTEHYKDWLTSSIPILGNKTPKELSKTKAGREKLMEALKGVENSVRHLERESGVIRPLDLHWMWEELGMVREKVPKKQPL